MDDDNSDEELSADGEPTTPEAPVERCSWCRGKMITPEYLGGGWWVLVCVQCGEEIADWEAGQPDWEMRQAVRVPARPHSWGAA